MYACKNYMAYTVWEYYSWYISVWVLAGANKFMLNLQALRSLHTESKIFVRIFRRLKNKYDLTLCQSRLHTVSETFVCQKKFRSGSISCVFASIACILIGKDGEYEKKGKTHVKISDSVCNDL